MGFMDLAVRPLAKYADFHGRARRAEYWSYALLIGTFWASMIIVISVGGAKHSELAPMAAVVLPVSLLVLIIPSIAVRFRRLHDIDKSAVWVLIAFIPVVGTVVLLIFSLIDGTRGPNQFGPDPKGREPATPSVTVVHHYHQGPEPAADEQST